MDYSKGPVAKRTRSGINRFLIEKHLEGKRVKTAAGAMGPVPEPVEFILVDEDEGGSGGSCEKGQSSHGDLEKKKREECNDQEEEVFEEEVSEQEMDDDKDADFVIEGEKETKSSKKKPASRITEADETAVFQSGEIPRPDNPFFLTERSETRNVLAVPTDVMRAFNIQLPNNLKIYDESNREWTAKVHVWKDGRTWLSAGWTALCRYNGVKPRVDLCLCEFILPEMEEDEIRMQVRVLRGAALSRPSRRS